MDTQQTIFVIMPFSKKVKDSDMSFDTIYFRFIKQAIEDLGYKSDKADITESDTADMLKRILNPLCDPNNYVLADLTDWSPNVLWELGIRHGLVKYGAILIIQDGKEIPFDLTHQEIIRYSGSLNDFEAFKKKVKNFIDKNHGGISPIQEAVYNYADIIDYASGWKQKYDKIFEQLMKAEERIPNEQKFKENIEEMFGVLQSMHEDIALIKQKILP